MKKGTQIAMTTVAKLNNEEVSGPLSRAGKTIISESFTIAEFAAGDGDLENVDILEG